MKFANFFSHFAVLLVFTIGISKIHAVEHFPGCECLQLHFKAFFYKLDNVLVNYPDSESKKVAQQFDSEIETKSTPTEFAELVMNKLNIIYPEVIRMGHTNELGSGIVNVCGDINKDGNKTCQPYRHNIRGLLGDYLKEIFMNLSGRSVNAYERTCENKPAIPITGSNQSGDSSGTWRM